MKCAMEMHDSFVLEVNRSPGGEGFILFNAVVFRADGRPAKDGGQSGWQRVRMSFREMTYDGPECEPDSYAYDGSLTVNGLTQDNIVDVPAQYQGTICLRMRVSDDFETRTISGSALSIELEGEFELESNWDGNGNASPV